MAAVAKNPAFAKKVGIKQSVGEEFLKADKGRKFGMGGRTDLQSINKPKTDHGKQAILKEGGMAKSESKAEMREEMKKDVAQDKAIIKKAFSMHDKQEHKGQHTDLSKLKKGGVAMKKMCGGGKMKKMASGGAAEVMGPRTMAKDVEAGSNKLLKFGESAVQKRAHTKGKNLGDTGPTKAPKQMAKGGSASSRADGIASKGKTKGKWC
jgi:hypothetical protein